MRRMRRLRDDPALVTDRLNAIIRARSSTGTHSRASPASRPSPRTSQTRRSPAGFTCSKNRECHDHDHCFTTRQPFRPSGFEPYREMADAELEERILACQKSRWATRS